MNNVKNFNQFLNEAHEDSNVKKLVDEINELLSKLVDSDGDKIPLIDKSGTWQEPCVYEPIVYKGGKLHINYTCYDGRKEKEVILSKYMDSDGIPTLKLILKLAKQALKRSLKKSSKTNSEDED